MQGRLGSHLGKVSLILLCIFAQVWERRALKSRHAKFGWVGVRPRRAGGKLTGDFIASVTAVDSRSSERIVLGPGFPTREACPRAASAAVIKKIISPSGAPILGE